MHNSSQCSYLLITFGIKTATISHLRVSLFKYLNHQVWACNLLGKIATANKFIRNSFEFINIHSSSCHERCLIADTWFPLFVDQFILNQIQWIDVFKYYYKIILVCKKIVHQKKMNQSFCRFFFEVWLKQKTWANIHVENWWTSRIWFNHNHMNRPE